MQKLLWKPDHESILKSRMYDYMQYLKLNYGLTFDNYDSLYEWSIEKIEQFWESVWSYFGVVTSQPYQKVVDDLAKFPGARWFLGAKMNYAENILKFNKKEGPVIIAYREDGTRVEMDYSALYSQVVRLATALKRDGVGIGDRVAGYLPNYPEAIVAMLATAAIGAVWCSCSTDLGPTTAVNRLGQVNPLVLITTDSYRYNGKEYNTETQIKEITDCVDSIKTVVMVGDSYLQSSNMVLWEEYLDVFVHEPFIFEQVASDAPLFIMFTSGTTGKPKCMVQSVGGVLISQMKELGLHCDIGPNSRLLYVTTTSWMMWNWQVSAIGLGAAIVLYDGRPMYPDYSSLWKIIEEEKVTALGISASYIQLLMKNKYYPKQYYKLNALRFIGQTGSALSDEGFQFVYDRIKKDVQFCSLAGGTEINCSLAIGNPISPVYSGEVQKAGLGMKIACYDEYAKSVMDTCGELVCEAPIPSMPIYFWNDENNKKYHAAYFEIYPGVWRHGDYILIHSNTHGITYLGRSDSVLKPHGVRIGTAEIYNHLEKYPEVADSLAVGKSIEGDQQIILFIKLNPGVQMNEELKNRIKQNLRNSISPHHVPKEIVQVSDIPMNFSGKKMESVITNMINGKPIGNMDIVANPDCLSEYRSFCIDLEKNVSAT